MLLATTLDTPSLFANPKQILDARRCGAGAGHACCPDLDAQRGRRQARLGQELRLDQAPTDAARASAGQRTRHSRPRIPGRRASASIPRAISLAHVVGYTDIDGKGLAGIERGLDDALRKRRRAGAAFDRRAGAVHPARGDRRRRSPSSTPSAAWASSWTCAPARSWRWCRCPISTPTIPARRRRRQLFNRVDARRLRDGLGVQDLHHRDGARRRTSRR